MQRPVGISRASDEHCIIDITPHSPQEKYSPRGRTDDTGGFRSNDALSGVHRRKVGSRFRMKEKWVHTVPCIVLLCLFTLWWFSYPVDLEIKDGRITAIHRREIPQPLDETRVDLTILAVATAPHASVPQKLSANSDTPLDEIVVNLTILALATPPQASVPWKLSDNNETEAYPPSVELKSNEGLLAKSNKKLVTLPL